MHSALGKTEISPAEYYALFRDICAETTLARPPQVADCVIVGDTGQHPRGRHKSRVYCRCKLRTVPGRQLKLRTVFQLRSGASRRQRAENRTPSGRTLSQQQVPGLQGADPAQQTFFILPIRCSILPALRLRLPKQSRSCLDCSRRYARKTPPTRRSSGTNSTAARGTLCAEGTLPFFGTTSRRPPQTR